MNLLFIGIGVFLIGIALAILTLWLVIDIKNKNCVIQKSERVHSLLELNETVHFEELRPEYLKTHACNSKRSLERFSFDDYFITELISEEKFYRCIIKSVSDNSRKYDAYLRQIQQIKSTVTEEICASIGMSMEKFLKYENRLFEGNLLDIPQVDVTIICRATYVSPQGRNRYQRERRYNYDNLKFMFDRAMKVKFTGETRQAQIKVERSKMTASMRYDILRRDGYRCKICGSSADDGVKLHVDHIIPVSKGGKTVASNLRTLCDRCNLGKSDKM